MSNNTFARSGNFDPPSVETDGVDSRDRKSTRLNSSHVSISYAVFCLRKKQNNHPQYSLINRLVRALVSFADVLALRVLWSALTTEFQRDPERNPFNDLFCRLPV